MKYSLFHQTFGQYIFFSTDMIYQMFPSFDARRLSEWKQQKKIINIIRGWRCFADRPRSREFLYTVANALHSPSYISMESALSYYQLIPETVITITSCATKKTSKYISDIATFQYRTIASKLYCGYEVIKHGNHTYTIASPEKAICDMLMFYPDLNNNDAFDEWRINDETLREQSSPQIFLNFLALYNKKTQQRIMSFISYIRDHA